VAPSRIECRFDTAIDAAEQGIEDLDASAALARAVERRRAADAAEAELLAVAAHWADLHAVLPGEDADGFTVPGAEELVPLAGPGTPRLPSSRRPSWQRRSA
jgi:hypothetical protein